MTSNPPMNTDPPQAGSPARVGLVIGNVRSRNPWQEYGAGNYFLV